MSARRPRSVETANRLAAIAGFVKAEQARRSVSQRAAAEQMGISPSTLSRFEAGQLPDVPNFLAILAWLDLPLAPLLGDQQAKTLDAYERGWNDCAAVVVASVRTRTAADA